MQHDSGSWLHYVVTHLIWGDLIGTENVIVFPLTKVAGTLKLMANTLLIF